MSSSNSPRHQNVLYKMWRASKMKVWNREKKNEAKKTDEQAVDHDPDNINEDEETDEHAVDYDPDDIDEEEDEETDEHAVDYDPDDIDEEEDEETDEHAVDYDPDDIDEEEDEETDEQAVDYDPDDIDEEEDEETDEQAVDYDRDNIYEDEDEEFDEDDEFDEDEEFGEETVHYVPDDSYEEEDEEFDEETDGQIAQYNPQQAGTSYPETYKYQKFDDDDESDDEEITTAAKAVSEQKVKFPDDFPPELITMVANELTTVDRFNMLKAYPEQKTVNMALSTDAYIQRGLYLMVHPLQYDPAIQYNEGINEEAVKPFIALPPVEHLPSGTAITKEANISLGFDDLENFDLEDTTKLNQSFPHVESLKIVLRGDQQKFYNYQAYFVCAIESFSDQLVSLQILISSKDDADMLNMMDPYECGYEYMGSNNEEEKGEGMYDSKSQLDLALFLAVLNNCKWPRLKHFSLVIEDCCLQEALSSCSGISPEWALELLANVEQCYLRIPAKLLLNQLAMLEDSHLLQQFGFIVDSNWSKNEDIAEELATAVLSFEPAFARKIKHMHWNTDGKKDVEHKYARTLFGTAGIDNAGERADGNNRAPVDDDNVAAGRLRHFTALNCFAYFVPSPPAYLNMLRSLTATAHLRRLSIYMEMDFTARNGDISPLSPFDQPGYRFLRLPSVTSMNLSLKVTVTKLNHFLLISYVPREIIEAEQARYRGPNHELVNQLAIVAHFPGLQSLTLDLGSWRCSTCRRNVGQDVFCRDELLEPLKGLSELRQLKVRYCYSDQPCDASNVLKIIEERRKMKEVADKEALAKNEAN